MMRTTKRMSRSTVVSLTTLAALMAIGLVARPGMAQGVTKINGITGTTYVITQSGNYLVTADLSGSAFAGSIMIKASDVNLNLGGHTINASGDAIDVFPGYTNVDISNGTVTHQGGQAFRGIVLMGDGGQHVNNVTVTNFDIGIDDQGTGGDLLNGNVCSNNGAAIRVGANGSGSNSIIGNDCSNNAYGIVVVSNSNSIRGNTARNNSGFDLIDVNPDCGANTWAGNVFNTANQPCIK